MQPTPEKTKLERAEELDVAAKIAHENQDHVFAAECCRHAHHLRMQHLQETQHDHRPTVISRG